MKPPDQVFLAITFQDDTTGLMGFVTAEYGSDGRPRWTRLATNANVEALIAQAAIGWEAKLLPIKKWRFVSDVERAVFTSRDYRNAVVDTGTSIMVSMPKARLLHMDKIRQARARAMVQKDANWMKAMGQNQPAVAAAAETERETLRNMPQTLDLTTAQTPDTLKAIWPAILGPRE